MEFDFEIPNIFIKEPIIYIGFSTLKGEFWFIDPPNYECIENYNLNNEVESITMKVELI